LIPPLNLNNKIVLPATVC